MMGKKHNFKDTPFKELAKHEIERRAQLDLITLEILYYKAKIKQLKKKESKLWQHWMTVQHWINSKMLRGEV